MYIITLPVLQILNLLTMTKYRICSKLWKVPNTFTSLTKILFKAIYFFYQLLTIVGYKLYGKMSTMEYIKYKVFKFN